MTDAARGVLDRLGWRAGERTVSSELGRRHSLYQVRVALRELKAARRARERRVRESLRPHVRVLARGTIWSMDATSLGFEAWGSQVLGEIVRDVASTKALGASAGPPPDSREVVVLLQRATCCRGRESGTTRYTES